MRKCWFGPNHIQKPCFSEVDLLPLAPLGSSLSKQDCVIFLMKVLLNLHVYSELYKLGTTIPQPGRRPRLGNREKNSVGWEG